LAQELLCSSPGPSFDPDSHVARRADLLGGAPVAVPVWRRMYIDAYDVLGVNVDCEQEEIKKAFKKLSLKEHPDKAHMNGRDPEAQNARFIMIKEAVETLDDEDRRKRYDTFGQDLGKEAPEMEVWNIGLATLLQPMGGFMLKTTLCRLALWILTFRWMAYLIILFGIVAIVLYAININVPGLDVSIRSPEAFGILVNLGIVIIVVVLGWLWPLLADSVGVLYLVVEVASIQLDNLKVGAIALSCSMFLAWLLRGWWYWILGLEVILAIVLLVGVTIASGIIRLWIDTVQATRGDKVKEWRMSMRSDRNKLQTEVSALKKKLER